MAGTFTAQNKVRPGAYTVFKGLANTKLTSGSRGIVAIPMDLPWGDTSGLIKVTAAEFLQGNALIKIGLQASDLNAQPLREVFKNATTALVGRLNVSPVRATATVNIGPSDDSTALTLVAKYGGTLGNSITVSCVKNSITNQLELITTVGTVEVDRQVVSKVGDYIPNGWFEISTVGVADTAFTEFAGVLLGSGTPGTNGTTITANSYTGTGGFTSKCSNEIWNVMAVPNTEFSLGASIKSYIEDLRENGGKKVQAVVYDYSTANYEGIISVDQGYVTEDETVPVESFIAYVAGMTAGADITDSNTYKLIEGATSIINPKSASEIEVGLQSGKMILSYRQDRSIVIEKDINTLYNFPADRSYVFSKNRVIRCLDDIATQVTSLFENSFIGKVNNNAEGRTLFKAAVIGYLNELQARGAIQNFDSTKDIEVVAGNDIESVVCNLAIQTVDSMEKLYMTVVVS